MVSFPPCKINLGLDVISKRPDGFHEISTCFYPVQWTDILEIIPAPALSFSTSGISIPGDPDDNLCLRAFHLLQKDFDISPVKIHLHKVIPMGAGLGGGSSDAAWTLRLLNEIFALDLSTGKLMAYASVLGSDCSFFVQDSVMIGSGKGEKLEKISIQLADKYLVVVTPDVHVSTAGAYAGVIPVLPEKSVREIIETRPLEDWKEILKNDFESSVFQKYPIIKSVKEQLYDAGAVYAAMSGSGSSVFGIFNSSHDLKKEFPEMNYWSGLLTI
jgi:4-diphosphocytidyl-2-C-methyl-D-erythritol kinase